MAESVKLVRDGEIACVVLNRPQALNTFDLDLARSLAAHLVTLAADSEVRGVVIAGEGRAFSIKRRISRSDNAPTNSSTTCPFTNSFTAGMLAMLKAAASSWCSSVLTLASSQRPSACLAKLSSTGPSVRQGAHQGAQKSTSTGVCLLRCNTCVSKSFTS